MTPEQLDAIEATISESTAWDGWGLDRAQVSDLIAALREAWAERDDLFTRASIASGDARYLRAALDRVRALLREMDDFYMQEEQHTSLVNVSGVLDNMERLEAAIEGER